MTVKKMSIIAGGMGWTTWMTATNLDPITIAMQAVLIVLLLGMWVEEIKETIRENH